MLLKIDGTSFFTYSTRTYPVLYSRSDTVMVLSIDPVYNIVR